MPPVQISAPGGETSEVTLEQGRRRAVALHRRCARSPGLYKLQTPVDRWARCTAVAHAGIEDAREMSEVTATDDKLKPLVGGDRRRRVLDARRRPAVERVSSGVDVPRISMLANARVLAGSGWLGLKDREAFVTRGVKLIPMFTGFLALAALLALLALTWWREGR